MNRKNYYSILGIEKTASDEDIKKAYRRLAMKYHPDRNQGNPQSEEKFKEINEAYECLSDSSRRQAYDQGALPGQQFQHSQRTWTFGANGQEEFQEMFRSVFGNQGFNFGFGNAQPRQQQRVVINLSLEEAYRGKKVNADNQAVVNIPAGVRSGTRFFANNVLFHIDIPEHHKFKRSNDDLLVDTSISVAEAILGTEAILEHLDGSKLSFIIPAGIQPGQIVKLGGKGMPNPEIGRYGDLLVRISIEIPKQINDEEKLIFRKMLKRQNVEI
jgi:DnaJ-class molecular chaperone